MAARFLEQIFGEDRDLDAAAEAAASHAIGELGRVVLFGVSCEFGHVGWDWKWEKMRRMGAVGLISIAQLLMDRCAAMSQSEPFV
jgi:hypothetical protein